MSSIFSPDIMNDNMEIDPNIPTSSSASSSSSQNAAISATIDELAAEASKVPDQSEEEQAAQICVETILKLLTDPKKMCQLLRLSDFTTQQNAEQQGPALPQIVLSLRQVLSDRTVLARAARHFQHISDDSLYYLTTLLPGSRNMDDILKAVIEETHCMSPEGLEKLIQYLSELIAETVPKKFRTDKMVTLTKAELEEAESTLPSFEGDYNREDWLACCMGYSRSSYKMFDSSNISLHDVLKDFAKQYKGKVTEELWNCSRDSASYRASDSKYQRAYTCADAVDYEKIYKFLATMSGCRNVTQKDLNILDAAVITNIFQEMEEVIALNFDEIGRQMPIILEQMKYNDGQPDTGFKAEDVAKLEANPMFFPEEFRNLYDLEMKRRFHAATRHVKQNITEGSGMEE